MYKYLYSLGCSIFSKQCACTSRELRSIFFKRRRCTCTTLSDFFHSLQAVYEYHRTPSPAHHRLDPVASNTYFRIPPLFPSRSSPSLRTLTTSSTARPLLNIQTTIVHPWFCQTPPGSRSWKGSVRQASCSTLVTSLIETYPPQSSPSRIHAHSNRHAFFTSGNPPDNSKTNNN